MRERLKHRSLAPVEHGGADFDPAEIPVVEMAVRILHVVHRPHCHPLRQIQGAIVLVGEEAQSVNGLGSTLNVRWIDPDVRWFQKSSF
jgi:hypothetical protein